MVSICRMWGTPTGTQPPTLPSTCAGRKWAWPTQLRLAPPGRWKEEHPFGKNSQAHRAGFRVTLPATRQIRVTLPATCKSKALLCQSKAPLCQLKARQAQLKGLRPRKVEEGLDGGPGEEALGGGRIKEEGALNPGVDALGVLGDKLF